ncbi:hypothetical protein [Kitasatospora sp. NPDC093558]|uniref:hypothetical protein n=1 Tax=Kitasatospora sp. NPDC093558 TaxID=3155201 RepID=UPI0034206AAA
MIAGFLLSRTVGLPSYHEDGWEIPYGPVSLVVEALFVVTFVVWLSRVGAEPTTEERSQVPGRPRARVGQAY